MTALEREKQEHLLQLLSDIDQWLFAHADHLAAIRTTPFVKARVQAALEDHGWRPKPAEED